MSKQRDVVDVTKLSDKDRADYLRERGNLQSVIALCNELKDFEESRRYHKLLSDLEARYCHYQMDVPVHNPDAVNALYANDQLSAWFAEDEDCLFLLEMNGNSVVITRSP